MLRFAWDALRVGDSVKVHDDDDPGLAMHDGVVALVATHRGDANEVGFRVGGFVVRARRHAVHLLPFDRVGCWRCDASDVNGTRGAV